MLSDAGANAIIYVTYAAMLVSGVAIGWVYKDKATFLSANGTQKGIPLALNFVASGCGCGVLATYPQVANVAGLQGVLVYALAGGLPMLLFSFLGPKIRRQCPDGFVLTEWVFQRFGKVTGLYLSACTMLTLFLFMVSEVASVNFAINTLTGLDALPAVIVQCAVTTIYTSIGGFKVSFLTDSLQAAFVILLVIVVSGAFGAYAKIDTDMIAESGLLKGSKLGWQLVYILPMAIFTNDLFMSGFWLRTFAARSDKDLWIGCSIAAFLLTVFATIVGVVGLIAVWGNYIGIGDPSASYSLYIMLATFPNWTIAFTLIFVVVISTCTLDSLQSALTSTISNDVFRNKIRIIYCRVIVVLLAAPVIVIGVKVADDILQIYFIVDMLSSAVVPVILLGLNKNFWFLTAYEVISGGLGGLLSVFIFGTVYYGSAKEGGKLVLIWNGVYGNDWGPFGAFVVAPFGGLVFAAVVLGIRLAVLKVHSLVTGAPFTALDKPEPVEEPVYETSDNNVEVESVGLKSKA